MRRISNSFISAQAKIMLAITLQDMKTRYGSSYISYLVAIAWPFVHLSAIAGGYLLSNKIAPVGDDPVIFVATAAVPYIVCLYPFRLIALSIIQNKPFLSYTVISPLHLIFSRCLLEIINSSLVVMVVLIACELLGTNTFPLNVIDACLALLACFLFGLGFGLFNAVVTAAIGPFFIVVPIIIMILLYVGSLYFVPYHLLGSTALYYLEFNPVFVLITWLRSSYYEAYSLHEIPKAYVLSLSVLLIFFGLLAERAFRGKIR